jgi:hypothetical protein
MKATKQPIERNLKFDQKYVYLGITRGSLESGQATACENCGRPITNMVRVANRKTRQTYHIGTDCAETLSAAKCLYNNGSQTDYGADMYSYGKTSRFATELNKGKRYTSTLCGMHLHVENDRGRTLDAWKHDLQKFYPELVSRAVTDTDVPPQA